MIGHLFELFVGKRVSAVFSVLPSILIFFLLNKTAFPIIAAAAITAAVLRIVFVFLPKKETVITIGSLVLGALSFYLYFEKGAEFTGKITTSLLFAAILVLILSSVQKIFCERRILQVAEAFPFYFFMILGLLVLVIPKPEKPIDWSKALEMGDRLASSFNYYMPDIFSGGTYRTGYSNLGVTGGKVSLSDTMQLKIKTYEKPYFVFEDENGDKIKRRKTLNLSGGRGSEKEQIVAFVNFLHNNNVDKDTAKLFSEISSISLEYAYLKTNDEIAPLNALYLEAAGQSVEGGRSSSLHKKGYVLNVTYLNIDYGSPYLAELLRNDAGSGCMSFDETCDYFRKTYGPNLEKYVSRDEYDAACANGFIKGVSSEYLDIDGASSRLSELAKVLTEGISSDYDKCREIEKYLRQYRYSTDVESNGNTTYDINTSKGASALSERFLFETGEGYCIHYTSSMVMLLRLSGIPARASVGYHYMFPFDKADFYEVSGRCAHAWPEAYIENVGWVPFEPTSAYRSSEENTWNRVPAEANEAAVKPYTPSVAPAASSFDKELKEEETQEVSLWKELVRVVLPVSASVVGLLVVLLLGTRAVSSIRYGIASLDKKLEIDVNRIKRIIRKKADDDFVDRGLLSDYEKRVPEEFKASAKAVFGAYYRMLYGGMNVTPVTETEVEKAKELRENMQRI